MTIFCGAFLYRTFWKRNLPKELTSFIVLLLQENGGPRKEQQKKRKPGRERKWVRRSFVYSNA